MNLISIDNISMNHGDRLLFDKVSFGINEGQKVALIGNNGSGKSTMLKMIAGINQPETGTISRNKSIRIGFLDQIPTVNPKLTIIEQVLSGNDPLSVLIRDYESLCEELETDFNPELEEKLHRLTTQMDKHNAWEYESRLKEILAKLEIHDLNKKIKELSGGMIKKIALAALMVSQPDLLILDEPTNHLDVKTIVYLEEYLKNTTSAVLLVTHDRYFLDEICSTIIELDRKSITRYDGNYTFYLEKRSEIINSLLKEDDRIANTLRKELEWYKRQPKARTTKSKSRMDSIENMMDRPKYKENTKVEISVNTKRLGKKILELSDISKSYDNKTIIRNFSYTFKQYEKIGLVGPNGAGKSTLLNIITGRLKPDTGIIDIGLNTHFGYFTQTNEEIDGSKRVIDYIKESAEYIVTDDGTTITASKLLERFLFLPEMQYGPVSKLSGGEKRRLYLLKLLMTNPNFLILDEPTNDLDITTLSILEDFLETFAGCVIIVTHDRYFMNRTANQILVFEDGEIKLFPGSYLEYIEKDRSTQQSGTNKQSNKQNSNQINNEKNKSSETMKLETETPKPAEIKKKKLSYNEKKELETILHEIEKLELQKTSIEADLSSPNFDKEKIASLQSNHSNLEQQIALKIERWEYLESLE